MSNANVDYRLANATGRVIARPFLQMFFSLYRISLYRELIVKSTSVAGDMI